MFFLGMCAYGIIIGDTLPSVIRFVFPTLHTIPILKIFANRQFIIALCTTCVSYPLSLYRDIHKLSRASGLALIGMTIIVISVLIEGPHVPPQLKGKQEGRFSIIHSGVFQAIGVISFAFGESRIYPLSLQSCQFRTLQYVIIILSSFMEACEHQHLTGLLKSLISPWSSRWSPVQHWRSVATLFSRIKRRGTFSTISLM